MLNRIFHTDNLTFFLNNNSHHAGIIENIEKSDDFIIFQSQCNFSVFFQNKKKKKFLNERTVGPLYKGSLNRRNPENNSDPSIDSVPRFPRTTRPVCTNLYKSSSSAIPPGSLERTVRSMYRVHPNGRENGPLSSGHNGAVSFPMGERRGYPVRSASRNNNSCNSRSRNPPRAGRVLNKYNTRVIWLLGEERLTGAVDPVCTPSIARGCLSPPSFMLSPQYKPLSARGSISLSLSLRFIYIYMGMDGHLTNVFVSLK